MTRELSIKDNLNSPAPRPPSLLTGLIIGNNCKKIKYKSDGFCYKPMPADLQLMSSSIHKASFALLRSSLRNCCVQSNQKGLKSGEVTPAEPQCRPCTAGTPQREEHPRGPPWRGRPLAAIGPSGATRQQPHFWLAQTSGPLRGANKARACFPVPRWRRSVVLLWPGMAGSEAWGAAAASAEGDEVTPPWRATEAGSSSGSGAAQRCRAGERSRGRPVSRAPARCRAGEGSVPVRLRGGPKAVFLPPRPPGPPGPRTGEPPPQGPCPAGHCSEPRPLIAPCLEPASAGLLRSAGDRRCQSAWARTCVRKVVKWLSDCVFPAWHRG